MNISKRTLALIYKAAIWQNYSGSSLLSLEIYNAIGRIVPFKDLNKYTFSSVDEIKSELQKIGKQNKKAKKNG